MTAFLLCSSFTHAVFRFQEHRLTDWVHFKEKMLWLTALVQGQGLTSDDKLRVGRDPRQPRAPHVERRTAGKDLPNWLFKWASVMNFLLFSVKGIAVAPGSSRSCCRERHSILTPPTAHRIHSFILSSFLSCKLSLPVAEYHSIHMRSSSNRRPRVEGRHQQEWRLSCHGSRIPECPSAATWLLSLQQWTKVLQKSSRQH